MVSHSNKSLAVFLAAAILLLVVAPAAFGQTPGSQMGRFDTGSFFTFPSPAIAGDGSILVGCGDGYLYAFVPALSGYNWRYNAGEEIASTPAIGPTGNIYFSAIKKVFGIDSSGSHLWEFSPPSAGTMVSAPAVAADGTVYIDGANNYLYALAGNDGSAVWEYYSVGLSSNSPAIGIFGSVFIGSNSKFSSLDKETGGAIWENTTDTGSDHFISGAAIGQDGTIYIGSDGSRLYAFDWRTGVMKWAFDQAVNSIRSSPVIGPDGTVYFGSDDRKIYAVDGKTGAKKWEFATGGMIRSSPAVGDDGTVYVGSLDKKMYALNGQTGAKIWEFPTDDPIYSSPMLSSAGILYFTSGGSIYGLYSSSNGPADSPWPVEGGNPKNNRRGGPFALSNPAVQALLFDQ